MPEATQISVQLYAQPDSILTSLLNLKYSLNFHR